VTLQIAINGNIGEMYGGITVDDIQHQLDGADFDANSLRINTNGGCCITAIQILAMLLAQAVPIEATIELAASAAGIVALAAQERIITATGKMRLHRCEAIGYGDSIYFARLATELEDTNQGIAQMYERLAGVSAETITRLMNEDTWLAANECVALGLASGIC
jgi:ATP-dependent Clp protease protease subunit